MFVRPRTVLLGQPALLIQRQPEVIRAIDDNPR